MKAPPDFREPIEPDKLVNEISRREIEPCKTCRAPKYLATLSSPTDGRVYFKVMHDMEYHKWRGRVKMWARGMAKGAKL